MFKPCAVQLNGFCLLVADDAGQRIDKFRFADLELSL